jgi:hypothetical protein
VRDDTVTGLFSYDIGGAYRRRFFVPNATCITVWTRVVGWSMSATMTAQFVTDALIMAIWRRGRPKALLHHSDRGSPVHQRALPAANGRSRRHLFHEPFGQLLGQCGHGELLLFGEDRTDGAQSIALSRNRG